MIRAMQSGRIRAVVWRSYATISGCDDGLASVPEAFGDVIRAHEARNGRQLGGGSGLVAKVAAYVELGFAPPKLLSAIHRDARFLRSSYERVRENVECLRAFGFKERHLEQFLIHAPWTLRSDHRKLREFLRYFHQTLRLPRIAVANLCAKDPRVASLHLEKTILPCVEYFTKELEMPRDRFAGMVEKYPQVLSLSLETRIRPVIDFFLNELGTPPDAFLFHLRSFPGVLGCTLNKNVRFLTKWLESVTMADRNTLRYVCLRGLVLFSAKSSVVFGCHDALLEAFDGDKYFLARILRRVPHILSWPSSMLLGHLTFIRERLNRDLKELYHFPSLLAMSFKDQVLPRVEVMERIGFDHTKHPLFLLFGSSNRDFRRWLQSVHGRIDMNDRERERLLMEEMTHFEEEPLLLTAKDNYVLADRSGGPAVMSEESENEVKKTEAHVERALDI